MDKRVFLKVKLKSLAAEARVIKREEQRRKVKHDPWRSNGHFMAPEMRQDAKRKRAAEAIGRAGRRSRPWYPMSAQQLHQLTRHRLDVVRVEARLTNIAYAWIRGRDILSVDSLRDLNYSHLQRICAMVVKYGDPNNLLCMDGEVGQMDERGNYTATYLVKVELFKLGASEKVTVFPYARYQAYSEQQAQISLKRCIAEHANAAAAVG